MGNSVQCICANCGADDPRPRYAVARYWLCAACAAEADEQLELVYDLPKIRLYRCTVCGSMRSCRPEWRTCCPVCVNTPGLRAHLRTRWERENETLLRAKLEQHSWPGWEVLACDVDGLPFGTERARQSSHGTWGRHEVCGTVQLLDSGRPECTVCPPDPDSRTHRARADEPALLYLVRFGDWQKYGIGLRDRLLHHLVGGAEAVQVLGATHREVVEAERMLKRRHPPVDGRLPKTFGAGTEVVPASVPIDLRDVLPDGEPVQLRK